MPAHYSDPDPSSAVSLVAEQSAGPGTPPGQCSLLPFEPTADLSVRSSNTCLSASPDRPLPTGFLEAEPSTPTLLTADTMDVFIVTVLF